MEKAVITSITVAILSFSQASSLAQVIGGHDGLLVVAKPQRQMSEISTMIKKFEANGISISDFSEREMWSLWCEMNIDDESKRIALIGESSVFQFSVEGAEYDEIILVAKNTVGGRGYIRNIKWNCDRLVFRDDDERRCLARWFRKFYGGDELSDFEELHFYLTVPFPNFFFTGEMQANMRTRELDEFAPYLGDFMHDSEFVEFVFDVAFEHGRSFTRERCLRGMASAFNNLPVKVQRQFLDRVDTRLSEFEVLARPFELNEESELELLRLIRETFAEK